MHQVNCRPVVLRRGPVPEDPTQLLPGCFRFEEVVVEGGPWLADLTYHVAMVKRVSQNMQPDSLRPVQMLGKLSRHSAHARGPVDVAQVNVTQNVQAIVSIIATSTLMYLPGGVVATVNSCESWTDRCQVRQAAPIAGLVVSFY